MEQLKRQKRYKAEEPIVTINKIRSILCDKLGILLEEANFKSEGGFYSSRIKIGNYSLGNRDLGTNGKGMSFSYALASAHGEFMERMQNQAIIRSHAFSYKRSRFVEKNADYQSFLQKNGLLLDFQYAPDEEYVEITGDNAKDVLKHISVTDIDALIEHYKSRKLTLLPFFNATKGTVEKLPYELIFLNCTSNGMCAGNTAKEALIQGISEIIERYILREMYHKGLSLPTIDDKYFEGTEILNKVSLLRKKYGTNWSFQIKDCSLEKNYPAVGILMYNHVERKYLFHLGVDPSPITALERSLTEIYQGRNIAAVLDMDFEIQYQMLHNAEISDAEFYKTCTTGSGHYPISILQEPKEMQFHGFDPAWGLSDDSDLLMLKRLIERDGYELFIRDVSFLDFPAYCVYIPGMTEFRNVLNSSKEDFFSSKKAKAISTALNLNDASTEDINNLIKEITKGQRFLSQIMEYDRNCFLTNYNFDFILAILYISIKNYHSAYDHIKIYMQSFRGTPKEAIFFSGLKDYLYCKMNGYNTNTLSFLYSDSTITSISDFAKGKSVFRYVPYISFDKIDWPSFILDHPDYLSLLTLIKRMEQIYAKNTPNQMNLNSFFNS